MGNAAIKLIQEIVINDTGNTPTGATNGEPNGEPGTPGDSSHDAMYDILTQMGYGKYFQKFIDDGFDDPQEWAYIEYDDLIEMGMKKGHARGFMRKVKELQKNNDEQTDEQKKQGKIVQIIQNGEVYNYSENNSNNNMEQKDEHKDEHKDEQKTQTTQTQNNQSNNNNINNNNNTNKSIPNKPPQKKTCSLLFVGETGVGKSTLLKSFEDFINGVKFEDVNTTPKIAEEGQSQTQESSQFSLTNDEWLVTIIDTPGIGDTNGFKTDQQHLDNIIKHIGQFGDFNAVCLLIKRGTTRASTRLKYIIGELKAHMPKDVKDNFMVIMTRSDVPIPDKDTLKVIEILDLPIDNIIPINNCSYEELDLSRYKEGSAIRKMVKARQKTDYYANHEYLQLLLNHASQMKLYQGKKILDLKIQRDKLKEEVGVLKMKIDDSFEIQKKIKENIVRLKSAKNIKELNKAYDQSKKAPKFRYFKETGKITTHCSACSKACHINCTLSYGDDLNRCYCAGRYGKCYKCGCSMTSHTHLGWKKKTEWEIITCINDDMKLQWKNAKDREQMIEDQLKTMKDKLDNLEKERHRFVESIQQKYKELKSIAIVGYNENFDTYIKECIKAVENDRGLSYEAKEQKIGMFKKALKTFKLFLDVVNKKPAELMGFDGHP